MKHTRSWGTTARAPSRRAAPKSWGMKNLLPMYGDTELIRILGHEAAQSNRPRSWAMNCVRSRGTKHSPPRSRDTKLHRRSPDTGHRRWSPGTRSCTGSRGRAQGRKLDA
eukprot:12593492-Alexandrium_andersonii.AAC.1